MTHYQLIRPTNQKSHDLNWDILKLIRFNYVSETKKPIVLFNTIGN